MAVATREALWALRPCEALLLVGPVSPCEALCWALALWAFETLSECVPSEVASLCRPEALLGPSLEGLLVGPRFLPVGGPCEAPPEGPCGPPEGPDCAGL